MGEMTVKLLEEGGFSLAGLSDIKPLSLDNIVEGEENGISPLEVNIIMYPYTRPPFISFCPIASFIVCRLIILNVTVYQFM